eukprot:4353653-Heterocapsa_arctica.AAC.1
MQAARATCRAQASHRSRRRRSTSKSALERTSSRALSGTLPHDPPAVSMSTVKLSIQDCSRRTSPP